MLDAILADFKRAWLAGEQPDPGAFLARAPEAERDELGSLLDAWVLLAPSPPRDEARIAPLLAAVDAGSGAWGAVLPPLREARSWSVRELAARLSERLGLGAGAEAKAAGYLERMERGELAPAGVSRRVLDALGELLGTTGAALAGAAATPRPAEATLFRARAAPAAAPPDFEALSGALHTPAPEGWDEVDELFRGGRG